jgi:cell fate regulator YaaT (PSP1 superfamily)
MVQVVGVCFRKGGKTYDFKLGDLKLKKGDIIVVETADGTEAGEVRYIDKEIKERKIISSLKPILRKANSRDLKRLSDFTKQRKEALETFAKKIHLHKLEMKPVNVDFSFDNKRIIFFFVSETRVDFRELVKDLARFFKKQIILRQVGPRDATRMQGGYGVCGEPLCCGRFLEDLGNVAMDMVRDQDLEFRGSEKLSGLCGRLKCCLAFEEELYKKLRKGMPELGTEVEVEAGRGIIVGRNILKQKVEVELKNQVKVEVSIIELKSMKNIRKNK